MSTISIICVGIVFTITVVSIFSTLAFLSQAEKHDEQITELLKEYNKDNE